MTGILLLGIAHGLSDAAAGFAVGVLLQKSSAGAGLLIFLYNGLAFGLQPIAGLVLDRLRQAEKGAAFGLILTSIGLAVFWVDPRLGILLIGLGSAFFHAAGGAVSILSSPGKASGPGVFAAFGVIGLAVGIRLSFTHAVPVTSHTAIALIIFMIWVVLARSHSTTSAGNIDSAPGFEFPVILIIIAYGLRSFVWTGVEGRVDDTAYLALFLGVSAGIGKLAGGFLSDRIGWMKWTFLSLAGAALMLTFARDFVVPLLLGVFLLHSVTGLTMSWLGRVLPDSPAFAASLALGASVMLGGLPFVFTAGTWFGTTAIFIPLLASLSVYWVVLREKRKSSI